MISKTSDFFNFYDFFAANSKIHGIHMFNFQTCELALKFKGLVDNIVGSYACNQ